MHVESPNGRTSHTQRLEGRTLECVDVKGKHLGYVFGKDRILHVHLGRYGDWTEGQMPLPEVRGMLRLRMWPVGAKARKNAAHPSARHAWYSDDDGTHATDARDVDWLELRGASDCSVWTDAQWAKLMERIGPDPLHGDDPAPGFAKIAKAKTSIAALLMDQSVLAGIGNIYRAELLFRERLDPMTPGKDVPVARLKRIWKEAVPLLRAGMVDRRIVTTKSKDRPTKKTGTPLREEVHYVYRRHGKPCFVCGTSIERKELSGRTLYWCPRCQVS
jgi:endonuclease-8